MRQVYLGVVASVIYSIGRAADTADTADTLVCSPPESGIIEQASLLQKRTSPSRLLSSNSASGQLVSPGLVGALLQSLSAGSVFDLDAQSRHGNDGFAAVRIVVSTLASLSLLEPVAALLATSLICSCAWLVSHVKRRDVESKMTVEPSTQVEAIAVALADASLHWRHLCMFFCTFLSYMATGALNDPIGIVFPAFRKEWGPQEPNELAATSTALAVGLILSNVVSGALCDKYGRLIIARCGTVVALLAFAMASHASSIRWLAMSRFIGGLGQGAATVGLSTLLSECMPTQYRCLLVLYQCGWPLGATMFTLNYSFFTMWRWAVVSPAAVDILLLGLLLLPGIVVESPRFLYSKHRRAETKDVLSALGVTQSLDGDDGKSVEKAEADNEVSGETQITAVLFGVLLVAFACQAVASQLVKVWLPEVLVQSGALPEHSGRAHTFTIMWAGECLGIMLMGLAFGSANHRCEKGRQIDFRQLHVAACAFLCSSTSVFANLIAQGKWLLGALGGLHLLGQACAFNFLFAFATIMLPVSMRARCISSFFAVSYAGVFLGPFVGSLVLSVGTSEQGARAVIFVATGVYFVGALACVSVRQLLSSSAIH